MDNRNKEIDKYIANSAEFAKPILTKLRGIIHKACPDIVETIKWSRPNYDYKGKGMCVTDALKERVTFGIWHDSLVYNNEKVSQEVIDSREVLGRLKSINDIPNEKLIIQAIKVAMDNIDNGVKEPKVVKPKKELIIPEYFTKILNENTKSKDGFDSMSPSHKREYIDWIVDAKTEETRVKRIQKTLEQVVEGKSKHWKYQK